MNSEHYNFNRKMITSLKDVLGQVSMYETTSETNLRQFRERMAANRAEREARAEERRAKREAEEAAKNTPEAIERRLNLDRQRVDAEKNRDSNTNPRTEAESALLNASLARLRKAGENPQMPKREPGPNAGKIRPAGEAPDTDAQGRPLSINRDGSFNIPQAAQAEAQANRDAMRDARAQPPQPGQVGGPGGYINPNSPEGRVFDQIKRGELPADVLDTTRGTHRNIIDAVRGTGIEVPERELGGPRTTTPSPRPQTPAPRPQAPAPRPAPVPPRPTPLQPQAPRPTPLQPEAERPTPLKPQEGSEDFSQLFASGRRITPPSIAALSRMRRTGLA